MNENGKIEYRRDWPAWIILAGMFALGISLWSSSPEQMPVHWGLDGQPDRMGGKFEGLLLLPLISLGSYLMMVFLPKIDPGRANYGLFKSTYTVFRVGIVTVLGAVYMVALAAGRNPDLNLIGLVPVIIGALFIIIGNLMGKIRPNWFVGIRTPWTLTSKLSWTHTHRVGGRVMMLVGLVLLPFGYLTTPYAMAVLLALVLGMVAFLFVYSYLIWRRDPDRVSPAGSRPVSGAE